MLSNSANIFSEGKLCTYTVHERKLTSHALFVTVCEKSIGGGMAALEQFPFTFDGLLP